MKKRYLDPRIYPDEIFMDSKNMPGFDTGRFEGRIEKAISKKTFWLAGTFFFLLLVGYFSRVAYLQVARGEYFTERSEKNSLRQTSIIPNRGVIYDRRGEKLAWNEPEARKYAGFSGLAHVLGYVGLPSKEDMNTYKNISTLSYVGKDGVEKKYNELLFGTSGIKLVETDAQGKVFSESVQDQPKEGESLHLSIDARLQDYIYKTIGGVAKDHGYQGGAGVIMDVNTGEVLSLVSYPEYDSSILSSGGPADVINNFFKDKSKPFLNRVVSGLYAPGSIIKPMVALAALNEGTISPNKEIFSAGSISVPNPYFPDKKSVFYDWKAHGWVDMRRALAVSSDVYFYAVGGGFEDQKGLGIKKIEEYAKRFGFDSKTKIDLFGEASGTIPSPELKKQVNKEDQVWRVGDTYISGIGQGMFQVTPIEVAAYAASLANKGKVFQPRLLLKTNNSDDTKDALASIPQNGVSDFTDVNIPEKYFKIVQEGMRMSATEGTAGALNMPFVEVAAKTGTAEIGKKYINSWTIGYFPYDKPKYAFAIVMERGPYHNTVGGVYVMKQILEWLNVYAPEYLK